VIAVILSLITKCNWREAVCLQEVLLFMQHWSLWNG